MTRGTRPWIAPKRTHAVLWRSPTVDPMRLSLLLFVLFATSTASAQGTGTIAGQVLEADGITTVIGGTVRIDGTELGSITDIDGNYRINGVPVGTYNVTASFTGYTPQTQTGVDVNVGISRQLNFTLGLAPFSSCGCVCGYQPPLIARGPVAARITLGNEFEEVSNDPCVCPWPRFFWRDA